MHKLAELTDAEADRKLIRVLRGVIGALRPGLPEGMPVLHCAKGIEAGSLKTMSEVSAELLPNSPFAVLSGPTFAAEVARGLPTAVTIASHDRPLARGFAAALGSIRFRPYLSSDPTGAEIGGAVKNVMAIATGICDGLGLGLNARAALITRGLAEITRLGVALGGRLETFMGLAGAGDLILTCTGELSRNRRVGLLLGQGRPLDSVLADIGHVAEVTKQARHDARGIDRPPRLLEQRQEAEPQVLDGHRLDVRIDGLVNIYSYAGRAPVIVVYAATATGGTLAAEDDECLDTALFAPAAIPWDELAFRSTHEGLRDYLAGLLHPVRV